MGVYIKGITLEQFNEFSDILDFIGVTVNQSNLIEVTEPQGDVIGYTWKLEPVESEDV